MADTSKSARFPPITTAMLFGYTNSKLGTLMLCESPQLWIWTPARQFAVSVGSHQKHLISYTMFLCEALNA